MAITVGEPIGRSIARARLVCFRPFSWRKWMVFAVAVWLASMHEMNAISAGPFMLFVRYVLPKMSWDAVADALQNHLWTILGWMTVAVFVLFWVYLLFRWINCRGYLMMLDAVAKNRLSVKRSWGAFRELGNSLVWLRVKWDLAIFNLYLAVLVAVGALLWPDFRPMLSGFEYRVSGWTTAGVSVGLTGVLVVSVLVILAQLYFYNLIVPVMYVRNLRASEAFAVTRRQMFRPHFGACMKYLLLLFVGEMIHGSAGQVATIAVTLGTCLIGGLLFYVPVLLLVPVYLAMVLVLPIEVFFRAYNLYFVEQFGPSFQVAWERVAPRGFEVMPAQRQINEEA